MKKLKLLTALTIAGLTSVVSAATVTNNDVIKMVGAGLDESIILSSIQNGDVQFDTSSDGLIALSKAGVPKAIITAIIQRGSEKSVPKATVSSEKTPSESAPATQAPAEPVNTQSVFAYDKDKEIRLLYNKYETVSRARALGFGGAGVYYSMSGSHAKTQMKTRSPAFKVWLSSDTVPETEVSLTVWAVQRNDTRQILTASAGYGSFKTGFPKERLVRMTFTKLDEQSSTRLTRYELKPESPLQPGEYALILGGTRCFDFGIE